MKDFINIADFTAAQLSGLIERAIADKAEFRAGRLVQTLTNRTLAMIFEKPSLRTRVSFEAAMTHLGGHAIYLTKADIGLIQGSFTIVGALVSLVWGFLADKYNRKLLLLLSVLVGEIPCFLSAFVQSFPQLFITRALTGIGVGALFPVVFSFAGDTFKESHRPKVNAFLSTAISLGAIVGMVIAGFTGSTLGWVGPQMALPIIAVISVPVKFRVMIFPSRMVA